jgi:hypothetical protein
VEVAHLILPLLSGGRRPCKFTFNEVTGVGATRQIAIYLFQSDAGCDLVDLVTLQGMYALKVWFTRSRQLHLYLLVLVFGRFMT